MTALETTFFIEFSIFPVVFTFLFSYESLSFLSLSPHTQKAKESNNFSLMFLAWKLTLLFFLATISAEQIQS